MYWFNTVKPNPIIYSNKEWKQNITSGTLSTTYITGLKNPDAVSMFCSMWIKIINIFRYMYFRYIIHIRYIYFMIYIYIIVLISYHCSNEINIYIYGFKFYIIYYLVRTMTENLKSTHSWTANMFLSFGLWLPQVINTHPCFSPSSLSLCKQLSNATLINFNWVWYNWHCAYFVSIQQAFLGTTSLNWFYSIFHFSAQKKFLTSRKPVQLSSFLLLNNN